MHLETIQIERYPALAPQTIGPLPGGLVLIVGENESGKTALRELIGWAFFGDLPVRDPRDAPASAAVRLGVRLRGGRAAELRRDGDAVHVALEGEPPEAVEPAVRLLEGLDRATYERIFSLGLEDLGCGELVRLGDVPRLADLGGALGAAALPAAREALDEELARLFDPHQPLSEIRLLTDEWRAVEGRLSALAAQPEQYAQLEQRSSELQLAVTNGRAELEPMRRRLARLELLRNARQSWVRWQTARQKAQTLEAARNFPPSGLVRYQALTNEIAELHRLLEENEEQQGEANRRLEATTPNEALLRREREIEDLAERKGEFAALLEELPTRRQLRDQREADYRAKLQGICADWDDEQLSAADTSLAACRAAKEIADQFHRLDQRLAAAEAEQQARAAVAEGAAAAAEEARQRLAAFPTPPITDRESLAARQAAVRSLGVLVVERGRLQTAIDEQARLAEEAALQRDAIERRIAPQPNPVHAGLLAAVAVGGAALAALAAWIESPWTAALLAAAALTVVAILFRFRLTAARAERLRLDQLRQDQAAWKERLAEIEERRRQLAAQYEALERRRQELAAELGASPPETAADFQRIENDFLTAAERFHQWKALVDAAEAANAEAEAAQRQADAAAAVTAAVTSQRRQLETRWRDWLAQRRLADQIVPEQFDLLVQAVESARQARRQFEEADRAVVRLESAVARLRGQLRSYLAAAGLPDVEEPGINEIDALTRALGAARRQQRDHQRAAAALQAAEDERRRLTRQLQAKQTLRKRLLEAAGADDETAFLKAAEAHEQWLAALQEAEEALLALRLTAGSPERVESLTQELEATEPVALDEQWTALADELRERENQLRRHQRELRSVERQLGQIADDHRPALLLVERSVLESRRRAALRRWMVWAICRGLLERAAERFDPQRFPQVFELAGQHLERLTAGRYRLAVEQARLLVREREDCPPLDAAAWSDGLADQVGLSLRLAVARELSRQGEPPPLCLDDVLVRYDRSRQRQAARLVAEIAAQQQVWVFTSQPDLAQTLAAEAAAAGSPFARLEMHRGVVRTAPADAPTTSAETTSPVRKQMQRSGG